MPLLVEELSHTQTQQTVFVIVSLRVEELSHTQTQQTVFVIVYCATSC